MSPTTYNYNDAYNAELYPLEVVGGDLGGAVETLNSVTDTGRRGGTTFSARHPGQCAACGDKITPGDAVTYGLDDQLEHVSCPDLLEIPAQGVCAGCNLVLTPAGKCSGWCE